MGEGRNSIVFLIFFIFGGLSEGKIMSSGVKCSVDL